MVTMTMIAAVMGIVVGGALVLSPDRRGSGQGLTRFDFARAKEHEQPRMYGDT